MPFAKNSKLAGALALSLGLTLGACGGMPTNNTLYSVKQPIVERSNFTLDVATQNGELPVGEQTRIVGWFEAMNLQYGDRISVDDPSASVAVKTKIAELASRYGILVNETAPTTAGYLQPGEVRIVVSRSTAYVPGCPDWSAQSDMNYRNATSPNFGCATNSNLAAMVADPEDLLRGKKGSGETVIATSNKAIQTYRDAEPTGANGLLEATSEGDN